ncbi:MAG: hypothetical protein ACXW1Y_01925 [Acidimicrobiia bacterium]
MKRILAAFGFLVVALGVFAITDSASAKDSILNSFTTTYPATAGSTLDSCSTCHTSVPALNAYGAALRADGLNFSAIEGLDSDGDGVTNLTEIRNLTGPGNVAAFPTTTTTTTTTPTSTTSTASTTSATSTTPTTPAATPPAAAPSASAGPASSPGAEAFDAGPAGTVWLAIVDGRLVVTQVESDWSYSQESEDDGDREIEIKFRSGDQEVEFEAELEDGAIRTKVNMESGDDHYDDGGFDDHQSDDHGDDQGSDVKGDDHGSDHDDDRDDDHGEHEDD